MGERKEGNPLQFRPSAVLGDLYNAYALDSEVQLSLLHQFRREFLESWLLRTWAQTQNQNAKFAEEKFRQIREVRGDWSYDGMWVDENGEIVGEAIWSTYRAFLHNAQTDFSMTDLVSSIVRNERMVYPLSPKYETVLFWLAVNEEQVMRIIDTNTGDYLVRDYPEVGDGSVRMARIRQGKVGAAKFAREGITMGNLGFWESRRLALGQYGHGIYVPRVAFRDTALLPKGAYITPLDAQEVKARGGRLMEEKYPDAPIVRVGKEDVQADFIAAALSAQRPNKDCSVVLSYTTPRLWLGEGPKHGLGRTTSEPTVSHL